MKLGEGKIKEKGVSFKIIGGGAAFVVFDEISLAIRSFALMDKHRRNVCF